jgi:Plasmid pRiA4b ORF-3-like protein
MSDPEQLVIYQLHIFILGISPMIWRRVKIRSDSTIADLHYIIQIAMGWTDSHLHRFIIHGKHYGIAKIGGMEFSDDPKEVKLSDFGLRMRERFLYEYDFGDNWQHQIRVEAILAPKSNWYCAEM